MRRLICCPNCHQQYDVSHHQPGEQLTCRCGQAVQIRQAVGHDASVVRCSSCGAPRQENTPGCLHCGADFTIHERDLHTVCPHCLARTSDSARYCHHCGGNLFGAVPVSGDTATAHACPVCGDQWPLHSRSLARHQAPVEECRRCGGLWLSMAVLRRVIEHESRAPGGPMRAVEKKFVPHQGPRYRPCADCGQLMGARNFGDGSSGVILDICRSHGVWFDADELSQLLAWLRAGGIPAAQQELARLQGRGGRQRLPAGINFEKYQNTPPVLGNDPRWSHVDSDGDLLSGALHVLASFLRLYP